MQILSWVCLILLMLAVGREATAAALPTKMAIGFAAMHGTPIYIWKDGKVIAEKP